MAASKRAVTCDSQTLTCLHPHNAAFSVVFGNRLKSRREIELKLGALPRVPHGPTSCFAWTSHNMRRPVYARLPERPCPRWQRANAVVCRGQSSAGQGVRLTAPAWGVVIAGAYTRDVPWLACTSQRYFWDSAQVTPGD